nr:granulocyte-macrophage colony-stimulating factor receptor subunit alpha-like isoform X2 [Odocoileus virginianus texanus]
MVVLLDFVSLLVLLNSSCSTALGDTESPIVNVTLDPRKKILSWNTRGIVTRQTCAIVTTLDPDDVSPNLQVRNNDSYFCTFPNAVLHQGATLTVNATSEGQEFSCQLTFKNPGKEGSGAQNLSCVIYNIRFMNCSWTRGPAAPADVRYQLYTWTSVHGNVSECGLYILDSAGTRVGCHFDELGEGHTTDDYFFLVNGTSSDTDIQFLDCPPVNGPRLEKYNPPANLTVKDNVSHYVIRWDAPAIRYSLSNSVLRYALDIQKTGSFSKREPVSMSSFSAASVFESHMLRVPPSAGRALSSALGPSVPAFRGHQALGTDGEVVVSQTPLTQLRQPVVTLLVDGITSWSQMGPLAPESTLQ